MSESPYQLTLPAAPVDRTVRGWLLLALGSLVGAGLVVILIILARTPVMHDLIPWTGSFKTALVIHVDLSVLVWFLSFAGLLGTMTVDQRFNSHARGALFLALSGALFITFSPFLGQDRPFLNNYVPILANKAFFLGLFLFSTGFFGLAALSLLARRPVVQPGEKTLGLGLSTAFIVAFVALASLVVSFFLLPRTLLNADGSHYFELLFWGPGHILQFTHTQLQILVWVWLASISGAILPVSARFLAFLFLLGALPVLYGPVIYLLWDIESPEYRAAFTDLMVYGNGLATLPVSLIVLYALLRKNVARVSGRPERVALLFSLVLFAAGGLIGFMIRGVNVTIPAHYHGSIVSITLAYMGLCYHLLPHLTGRTLPAQWPARQLILYSAGSLLHIIGLAWSGSHGVQRKTAGSDQLLETLADKIPMWIMGLGGGIAVLGGILFLVIALRTLWKKGNKDVVAN